MSTHFSSPAHTTMVLTLTKLFSSETKPEFIELDGEYRTFIKIDGQTFAITPVKITDDQGTTHKFETTCTPIVKKTKKSAKQSKSA